MEMLVTFPGGLRVDAAFKGFTVMTDQPEMAGGEGSAPTPFEIFLSSLATCAGIFVLGFCVNRGIRTEGISIAQNSTSDPVTGRLVSVEIEIRLPEAFPDKYRDAIVSVANQCKVKKVLADPPEIKVISTKIKV